MVQGSTLFRIGGTEHGQPERIKEKKLRAAASGGSHYDC